MTDPLPDLAGRVRAMEQRPLSEHPDVLEEVQQEIVAELDRVGGWRDAESTPKR